MLEARVVLQKKRLTSRDGVMTTSLVEEVRHMPIRALEAFRETFDGVVKSWEIVQLGDGGRVASNRRQKATDGHHERKGVETPASHKAAPAAVKSTSISTADLINAEVSKL